MDRRARPAARVPPGTQKETVFVSMIWRVLPGAGASVGPGSTSGPHPQTGAAPHPAAAGHTATLDAAPAPWRSGYAAACKAVDTGSIPVGASTPSAAPPHEMLAPRGHRHRPLPASSRPPG